MIQPIDVKTHSFKKGLFGYKTTEVNEFIDTVYRAYEDCFKQREKLEADLEKLNASLQDCRLKMFEMENELNKVENVSTYGDDADAKKKADQIIKNAEAAAAEIIAKAKEESEKLEAGTSATEKKKSTSSTQFKFKSDSEKEDEFGIPTPRKQQPEKTEKPEKPEESASSKFFKKAEETASTVSASDDDDEIFVGEIEDARKPDRMMIGDGEEEEDMDFEFL